MTGRRSKIEIYLAVLSAIQGGEPRPTRIMYAANLSWKPLRQILDTLEREGLIENLDPERRDGRSKNLYGITEKGRSILNYFDKTNDLLKIESIITLD